LPLHAPNELLTGRRSRSRRRLVALNPSAHFAFDSAQTASTALCFATDFFFSKRIYSLE
jgi:hypothetical protein